MTRVFVFLLVIIPTISFSQCFSSPGSPIGGTVNTGVLKKGLLRTTLFTRYSYSDNYYEGSSKIDYSYYEKANYNFVGSLIAYGITSKLTFENEIGYFPFKTVYYSKRFTLPYYDIKGSGFSNWTPSLKLQLFANYDKRFYMSASAGAKIPFSRKFIVEDGVELPIDVQPSTGAFGWVFQLYLMKENSYNGNRYFAISRYEENGANFKNYLFGPSFIQSLFYSKHLYLANTPFPENWTAIIQLRYEYRNMNTMDGIDVTGTGGHALLICPQLNYTIKDKWNLSLSGEVPAYQYLNNKQLGRGWAVILNLTRDFSLTK